ncbi:MAG: hypothetical protein SFV32_03255 [Opitutaceae bacterium]|nr:hypothetical protein [Opitutaceae bacterium]
MATVFTSFSFSPAAVVVATGPDALTFTQGQFTQDIRGLEKGAGPSWEHSARYGLWLSLKGKLVGDSVIFARDKDSFLIFSESLAAAALLERLNSFLIADEVDLADETGRWSARWLAPDALPSDLPPGGYGARIPGKTDRGLVLFPVETNPPPVPGAEEEQAYTRFRYAHGLPRVPGELGEADLPQEAGLEAYAISFTKGCYLGQEVMARLHAMGQVRRRLVTVRGEGPVPMRGESVRSGAKTCGELRGAVADTEPQTWVGLAMLSRHAFDPVVGAECAGARLHVSWPTE